MRCKHGKEQCLRCGIKNLQKLVAQQPVKKPVPCTPEEAKSNLIKLDDIYNRLAGKRNGV